MENRFFFGEPEIPTKKHKLQVKTGLQPVKTKNPGNFLIRGFSVQVSEKM
jgi:hypothetical protein